MKTIRYLFLISTFILFGQWVLSQNIAINTTGFAPDASAILDIQSAGKGMLIPRMPEQAKDNISIPTVGLIVYQTDGDEGFWFFNGTAWMQLDEAVNIYNSNGSLTGNREVDQDNNNLTLMTGTSRTIVDGNLQHKGGAWYA